MLPARRPPPTRVRRCNATRNSTAATPELRTAPRSFPTRAAPRWFRLVASRPFLASLHILAGIIQPSNPKGVVFISYDTRAGGLLEEIEKSSVSGGFPVTTFPGRFILFLDRLLWTWPDAIRFRRCQNSLEMSPS